jgi:hypothetical protein
MNSDLYGDPTDYIEGEGGIDALLKVRARVRVTVRVGVGVRVRVEIGID